MLLFSKIELPSSAPAMTRNDMTKVTVQSLYCELDCEQELLANQLCASIWRCMLIFYSCIYVPRASLHQHGRSCHPPIPYPCPWASPPSPEFPILTVLLEHLVMQFGVRISYQKFAELGKCYLTLQNERSFKIVFHLYVTCYVAID